MGEPGVLGFSSCNYHPIFHYSAKVLDPEDMDLEEEQGCSPLRTEEEEA